MLMYGVGREDILNIGFSGSGVIYNLTTMREGFNNLRLLIPPNEIGRFTDRDFDIAYMNYILGNDTIFCEFFQIIYNLYIGNDVFILASEEDWSENILESLLKLIQQRYGYNSVKIDSDDDYIFAKNNMVFDFASGFGLYNLDQDKERFSYIIESFRLSHGGNIPYNIYWPTSEDVERNYILPEF